MGAAYFGRIHVMIQPPHLDWFDAVEACGMKWDEIIFTIGVVRDLQSLDLGSCSASLHEVVAVDDSVAFGL